MSSFSYEPSPCVPFRDTEAIAKCRAITREEITKHKNPKFQIQVMPDADLGYHFVTDLFYRIKSAADENKKLVLILPNPAPAYRHVARLINRFRVNCKNLILFPMDEYADQDGKVAPVTWELGFGYAMMKYLVNAIDPDLRPPESQVHYFTTNNVGDYSKMIEDEGEADAVYSGPGWTGHVAFVEPDAPEFAAPLDEWMKMGSRICTLSPFTLAQNSLHGSFGMSGDLAAVPPKAATIGPREIVKGKFRLEMHGIGVHGTATSWQRMISRLCLHGPVTPLLPSSIHQLLETTAILSETISQNIEINHQKGY